jgi:hypothetical protein
MFLKLKENRVEDGDGEEAPNNLEHHQSQEKEDLQPSKIPKPSLGNNK